jgi:hypothetical protein
LGLVAPALSKTDSPLPPLPPPIPGEAHKVWDTPDWVVYQWSLLSEWPPSALLHSGRLPGLRVTNAKLVLANGMSKWEIKGVFYAKN